MEGRRHWLLRDEAQSKEEHVVFERIESQVQAKASGGGELDLVVVQRTVREDILLNGCLHRARKVGDRKVKVIVFSLKLINQLHHWATWV